jgi:hypothetical protein
MSFWGTLGKIASIAGPLAAVPFTGGTSLLGMAGLGAKTAATVGGILGAAGKVAGSLGNVGQDASAIAAGRAAGRVDDATLQQRQDQLSLSRYNAGLNAADVDLARRKYALGAPSARASQSVRGDILANAQDVSINAPGIRIPQISGGLRPSMFSANTRALGGELSKSALADQQKGDTFDPLGAPPPITGLPQPGVTDKILTTAGYVGALAPDFMDLLSKYKRQPPATDQTPDWETTGVG